MKGRPMKTFIALIRGINVGGKNSLPMKDLKNLLENLKFKGVRTHGLQAPTPSCNTILSFLPSRA